jgi:hypothetical protein
VTDLIRGETTSYVYDDLDRLTGASGPFTEAYAYTNDNNMLTKTGSTYTYADYYHKHGVTSLSGGASALHL